MKYTTDWHMGYYDIYVIKSGHFLFKPKETCHFSGY